MAAALRTVRRLKQVLRLPRISVTSVRVGSGGKGSPHTEYSKTLVSFPVKVSHVQQPATGENRNEPPRPVMASLLEVGGLGGESDRDTQVGQEASHGSAQSVDRTSHKEDSDSSSDSSSDSEGEEDIGSVTDLQANKGEGGDGHKRVPAAGQRSPFSPGHASLMESTIAPEQKDRMEINMQDSAPKITTEKDGLRTAPRPTKMTLPGANKKTSDGTVSSEEASGTADASSKKINILSTSEGLPAGGIDAKSTVTQIQSTSTSEEPSAETVETSAPMSSKTQILSSTTSEELPAEEEAAELHESYSPLEPHDTTQEPFDNTKYQNLQHFSYTSFTFVDVDVEMAKYRLPQPSSGRPSPRH